MRIIVFKVKCSLNVVTIACRDSKLFRFVATTLSFLWLHWAKPRHDFVIFALESTFSSKLRILNSFAESVLVIAMMNYKPHCQVQLARKQ